MEASFCMGNSTERFLREMSWRDGGSLDVHTKARAVVTAGHMRSGGWGEEWGSNESVASSLSSTG